MSAAQIRLAVPSDREAVVRLATALWPDEAAGDLAAHAEAILAGRPQSTLPLVLFLALRGDAAIGFIEVGLRSHADGCDGTRAVGFLEGWFVVEAHRRGGVGAALVRAAEDWARAQGCTEIASDTWAEAEGSVHAHQALGYEIVDRAINFRKSLAPAPR